MLVMSLVGVFFSIDFIVLMICLSGVVSVFVMLWLDSLIECGRLLLML